MMKDTRVVAIVGSAVLSGVAYVHAACYVADNAKSCCDIALLPACTNPCATGQGPCCPLIAYSEPAINDHKSAGPGAWGRTDVKASGVLCQCDYFERACVNGRCEIVVPIPPSADPITTWAHPQIPDPAKPACQGTPGGGGGGPL